MRQGIAAMHAAYGKGTGICEGCVNLRRPPPESNGFCCCIAYDRQGKTAWDGAHRACGMRGLDFLLTGRPDMLARIHRAEERRQATADGQVSIFE